MSITLYHSVESTCAQKVRFVLTEKGLDWKEIRLDLRSGEQFDPEYLKLNPKAVVPTLVNDGKVVRESSVIAEYLDDAFPEPPLRPVDPYSRSVMRLVMKAFDEEMHPAIGILSYAIFLRHQMNEQKTPTELAAHFASMTDQARRERQQSTHELGLKSPGAGVALQTVRKVVALLDTCLDRGNWLAGGDQLSLADCSAVPYMVRTRALGLGALWAERPRVAEWLIRAVEAIESQGVTEPWGSAAFIKMLDSSVVREAGNIRRLLTETA